MWRKYIMTLMVAGLCLGLMGCTHEKFVEFHEDWESFWEMPAIEEEAPPVVEEEAPPVVEEEEAPAVVEEEEPPAVEVADDDGDGVENSQDNCPTLANADQVDADNDGVGDDCDNCRLTANADQADSPDADAIGNACDKFPDDKSTFAVKRWDEKSDSPNYNRYIEFTYSDEGKIEAVKWKTILYFGDNALIFECALSPPVFQNPPGTNEYLLPTTPPFCSARFNVQGVDYDLGLSIDEAKYIVDAASGKYKEVRFRFSYIDPDTGAIKTAEGITHISASGPKVIRELILNLPDPDPDLHFETTYEYDADGNIVIWRSIDKSTSKVVEARKYRWENDLLKDEKIAAVNLLFIDANDPNANCCLPASVNLGLEPGKTEPLSMIITEEEKLYKNGDLRYDLSRTIEFVQVKKAPELFDVFVDMAQPILFMTPKLTLAPPSELL